MQSYTIHQLSCIPHERLPFSLAGRSKSAPLTVSSVQEAALCLALPARVSCTAHGRFSDGFHLKESHTAAYVLLFLAAGCLQITGIGQTFTLQAQEGVLLREDRPFSVRQTNGEPAELFLLRIAGSSVDAFYPLLSAKKPPRFFTDIGTFHTLFQQLTDHIRHTDPADAVWTAHTLSRLLSTLYLGQRTSSAENNLSGRPPWLMDALAYMEAHCDSDLTAAALAARWAVSESHFYRVFKTHVGRSPHQHLIYLRIQRACALLTSTRLQIKYISHTVGFHSVNHFIAHFRRITGFTPAAYRRHPENSVLK